LGGSTIERPAPTATDGGINLGKAGPLGGGGPPKYEEGGTKKRRGQTAGKKTTSVCIKKNSVRKSRTGKNSKMDPEPPKILED